MQVSNYEEIIMEKRALLILRTVFQACVWLICSNQIFKTCKFMILPYVCNGVCLEYVGFIHEELEVSVYVPVLIAMFGISFSGKLLGSVVD